MIHFTKISKRTCATCASLLLTTALASCAVGPNYQAPTTQLQPFHNKITIINKNAPVASMDKWWMAFNDPELINIIQRVLKQNLDLETAMARTIQANALVEGSGAALLPTSDLNGAITPQHQSLNGPYGAMNSTMAGYTRNTTDYAIGPTASWEIDIAGGLRRKAAASQDELQAAIAIEVGTRITVAANAADAYFQIRGYQERLALAHQQIHDDEKLLTLIHARYQVGAADGRQIAQAEALLKQARTIVPPLRINLEQQLNRLDVLMGVQPGTYAKKLKHTAIIAIPKIPENQQPVDFLRRRPDIIAAERQLAASNERIGAALADYYPKVSLAGLIGFDSITSANFFTSSSLQATGNGAIRWRIFDFGKIDAQVKLAKGANAEALALYRQTVLRATEDVENSLMILAQTKIHADELQDEVNSLIKARNLSVSAYRAGTATLTDTLDADRQLLIARDALSAKKVDTARAAVAVFRSLGGGWNPP